MQFKSHDSEKLQDVPIASDPSIAESCAFGRYWKEKLSDVLMRGVEQITSESFTTCAAVCSVPNTHLCSWSTQAFRDKQKHKSVIEY